MDKLLLNLLFTELIFFLGVLGAFSSIEWYKKLFPHKDRINIYEEEVEKHLSESEEELLDEGFVEDMNNFDIRISDFKEKLKTNQYPPVEIITEEYEKSIERY